MPKVMHGDTRTSRGDAGRLAGAIDDVWLNLLSSVDVACPRIRLFGTEVAERSVVKPPQRLKGAVVEGNIVEGFPDDRFGDRAGLRAVAAEDDDAGVVVFHRQPPVILGPSYFADVLASLKAARWHVHRTRKRSRSELLRVTRVDEHRRAVHFMHVRDRLELDLGRATECTPDRDTELITSDVREPGRQEFLAQPLAATAEGAAAIEDDRRGLVAA